MFCVELGVVGCFFFFSFYLFHNNCHIICTVLNETWQSLSLLSCAHVLLRFTKSRFQDPPWVPKFMHTQVSCIDW